MAENNPKCACGCGEILVRRGRSGPAPQYATALCRKRAERQRKSGIDLDLVVHADPQPTIHVPVDEQIARAILEARTIGFAFTRLGTKARPELAWRCTKVGEAIIDALGESFGRNTTE